MNYRAIGPLFYKMDMRPPLSPRFELSSLLFGSDKYILNGNLSQKRVQNAHKKWLYITYF